MCCCNSSDKAAAPTDERVAATRASCQGCQLPGRVGTFAYCMLGIAYQSLGYSSKAIEYHTQHLAIAKEVGNRAGELAGRTRTSGMRMVR
jgi:hypothetical protein